MEKHGDYTFVFSTKITDQQRKEAEARRAEEREKEKGGKKGKCPHKGGPKGGGGKNAFGLYHLDAERLGMAIVYHKGIDPFCLDVQQHNDRLISLVLGGRRGTIAITGAHAPHAGTPESVKDQFYDQLTKIDEELACKKNIHYLVGDMSARLICRMPAEEHIVGPYVFGEEDDTLDRLSPGQK